MKYIFSTNAVVGAIFFQYGSLSLLQSHHVYESDTTDIDNTLSLLNYMKISFCPNTWSMEK